MKKTLIIIVAFVCFRAVGLSAQTSYQPHNFSTAGTTAGAATNTTQRLYSSVGQPVAQSSSTRGQTQAGIMQASDYIIVIVDTTPPEIKYTTPTKGITKGTTNTFSVEITDVNSASGEINYRPIASAIFKKAVLVKGVNTITVEADTWYDAMGMEYYFTAQDGATPPNTSRSPATGSYYAYLTDPQKKIPLTPGSAQNFYRVIGLPYETTDNNATVIFNELAKAGKAYDDTQWRIWSYAKAANTFNEYGKGGFTQLERGKGYWIIVKASTEVFVDNVTSKNHRNDLFKLTLSAGWNMIANPYPVDIDWSDVITYNNNNTAISDLQVYDGSGFVKLDVIAPFQGGFVKLPAGTADVEIKIPVKGQIAPGRIKKNRIGSDISAEAWRVDLHIFQSDMYNKVGGFGMMPEAKEQADDYDGFNPPRFLNGPEIEFNRLHDIKPCLDMVKTKTENTWKFQTMGAAGMDAALQWSEDVGQHSKELFLLDEENLVVVNMKEASRYSFTPTKQSHQFTIFFGNDVKEKITPTSIKILPPYPNPQKKNEAISFTISSPDRSADTQAEITLYTSNGTTALKQSRSIKLGINQLVIEPDHNLSSGMYLYRIQISNGTLQQTATGKIIIL